MPVIALTGTTACLLLLAAVVWSIWRPGQRVWPPERSTMFHRAVVWALTGTGFGAAILIGLLDWNALTWPAWLRWGAGLPMIVLGNLVVWREAARLGYRRTSGAEGRLNTSGLYRYSRNPQYVADSAILIGTGILSASVWVWPVVATGVAVLLLAPFAEEPWLLQRHGKGYLAYMRSTRRFF